MRLAFLTATPLNPIEGSGTYAGISALAKGLRSLGAEVEIVAPRCHFPVFTASRLWFNEQLRRRRWDSFHAVVGFDMDGYRLPRHAGHRHVASIKGVIADEMRFELGLTRLSMGLQAACEGRHVQRADLVITTSGYAAGRLEALYGLRKPAVIVPEAIDLQAWKDLFARHPAAPDPAKFVALTVCRFYPRKRLNLLLDAAVQLRGKIPGLEFRIVGNGPDRERLRRIWHDKRLEDTVRWLGDLSQEDLAREYQSCDLFCLPSVQEGFGIVFLEAMAAGKPIVAAQAAAVPEVVEHGVLVEPESSEALAEAILHLHRAPDLRSRIGGLGHNVVRMYNVSEISRRFLEIVNRL